MPRTDWGWDVTPEELQTWIIHHDDSILAVNKPAHLVCHPSKKGPWSSLVGACREWLGLERLHLVSRLDRETSGVVVIAKTQGMARLLQMASQERAAVNTYLAILNGLLLQSRTIAAAIGRDPVSNFVARQWVVPDGQASATEFVPLQHADKYSLVAVRPITGRRHQIRVHAACCGHSIVGDKLYGPDETLMLKFIAGGFTPDLQEQLKLDRHALHAYRISFPDVLPNAVFTAAVPSDLEDFWKSAGGTLPLDLECQSVLAVNASTNPSITSLSSL